MSVFLMGCFDPSKDKWVTVAKCGNGHNDKELAKIQKELKVKKIGKVLDGIFISFLLIFPS